MVGKKVEWEEVFWRDCQRQQEGSIFRQVCSVSFVVSWSAWRWEWSDAEKGSRQLFSAVHQLLLAARGRERLSHKSSSNWALLCTR
jgi:hypothetical protein